MLGFAKRGSSGGENAVEQPVLRGKVLLAEHRARLTSIRAIVGVPAQHWRWLYQTLFVAFAETVQRLPATEAHHHCEAGGLLRHALEVVELALKIRRGYVLPPDKEPEVVIAEQDVWTYAVASAALLHGVGQGARGATHCVTGRRWSTDRGVESVGRTDEQDGWHTLPHRVSARPGTAIARGRDAAAGGPHRAQGWLALARRASRRVGRVARGHRWCNARQLGHCRYRQGGEWWLGGSGSERRATSIAERECKTTGRAPAGGIASTDRQWRVARQSTGCGGLSG